GADVQVQVFGLEELALAQRVEQALGDDHGRVFAGLGQQDHKLIAAVAEGVVNEAKVRLDEVSDFGQQLRADEVAVGIVDVLEMVEVDDDHAELGTGRCVAVSG